MKKYILGFALFALIWVATLIPSFDSIRVRVSLSYYDYLINLRKADKKKEEIERDFWLELRGNVDKITKMVKDHEFDIWKKIFGAFVEFVNQPKNKDKGIDELTEEEKEQILTMPFRFGEGIQGALNKNILALEVMEMPSYWEGVRKPLESIQKLWKDNKKTPDADFKEIFSIVEINIIDFDKLDTGKKFGANFRNAGFWSIEKQLRHMFTAGITTKMLNEKLDEYNNKKLTTYWNELKIPLKKYESLLKNYKPSDFREGSSNYSVQINNLASFVNGTFQQLPQQQQQDVATLYQGKVKGETLNTFLSTYQNAKLSEYWTKLKTKLHNWEKTRDDYNLGEFKINEKNYLSELTSLVALQESALSGIKGQARINLKKLFDDDVSMTEIDNKLKAVTRSKNSKDMTLSPPPASKSQSNKNNNNLEVSLGVGLGVPVAAGGMAGLGYWLIRKYGK